MEHIYNFSAGPAVLPAEVLQQARDEMLDWHGSGMSVMEMSHRGKEFMSIAAKTEADFRELANIPDNYKVLFLSGGRVQSICHGPDEPAAWQKEGQLRQYWRMVKKSHQGSKEIL